MNSRRHSARSQGEVQESGVPWLGSVPCTWAIKRLRRTIKFSRIGTWGAEPDGINDIACVRVADFDRLGFRIATDVPTYRAVEESDRRGRVLSNGDLLLEKSGGGELQPVGAVARFESSQIAVCSNFLAKITCSTDCDSRFITYVHAHLYSGRVNVRSIKQTTGIQNLDSFSYFSEMVAVPPLEEQRSIASFLDCEATRIDRLIAEKTRLLDLLTEKRSAVITLAVTRGLNPNGETAACDLLGTDLIPTHWQIKQLGHISKIGNGSTPDRENPDYWEGGEHPWLNSSVVNLAGVYDASDHVTALATRECHLPLVPPGSVLVGITGEGRTRGMATLLHFSATINQHLAFLTPRPEVVDGRFLRWTLHSFYQALRLTSDGAGSTKGAITCHQLAHFKVPLPPLKEQHAICDHLESALPILDRLKHTVHEAIDLLREYRSALITAAVTGRIKVGE